MVGVDHVDDVIHCSMRRCSWKHCRYSNFSMIVIDSLDNSQNYFFLAGNLSTENGNCFACAKESKQRNNLRPW